LKGLLQPKAITAAMIKISTNSRFMSKIVRKNDQSNPLRKVGECLYRNGHAVYFAWFSVRGKHLKRSLKTERHLIQASGRHRVLAILSELLFCSAGLRPS